MRYFLAGFILTVAAVVLIAGKRGEPSRKPSIEIFDDMVRQVKFRPQHPNGFFGNERTSQKIVPGTVARGSDWEDNEMNTGRIPGTTNFVDVIPVPVTESLMERGQQRFGISCRPCHGALGDGESVVKQFGMATVASLHREDIVRLPDGAVFDTITHGAKTMLGYGASITVPDRWAIVAYVRALQRSKLAVLEDIPADMRDEFN